MSVILFGDKYDIYTKSLSISHKFCTFTQVPKLLSNFTCLERLTLCHNNITYLPKFISDFKFLTHIDFSYNNIIEISKLFGDLIYLELINLDNNQIKEIPDSLSNLVNLQGLCLSVNRITNVPLPIINLRQLRYFLINNNPIENINPIVQRFLDRIQDEGGNMHNMYKDDQNVHTRSIQQSVKDSIIRILSFKNYLIYF